MTTNRKYSAIGARGRHLTRRKLLKTTAGLIAASAVSGPLILVSGKARAAGKVYFASTGGSYGEALDKVVFKPLAAETGIEVIQTPQLTLAKLKAQIATGSVEWDLADINATEVRTAINENLLQRIDYGVVDASDIALPEAKQEYAVSIYTFSSGIGYDTQRHPEGKHPTTWAEFWDAKKFPGRRGLRKRPGDTLEIAMLAAGTDPKNVYPIDVNRAFKMLDEIKPHIPKWVETAPQTVELIQTHELDFTNTYNGRVFAAQKAGLPLGYATGQMLLYVTPLCVPKGARNAADAMKVLNYMMKPERQAALCEMTSFAPTSKKAMQLVPADIKKAWIPDMNDPRHLLINADWWGEPGRFAELGTRFREWLLT